MYACQSCPSRHIRVQTVGAEAVKGDVTVANKCAIVMNM